jgi:transposase
MDTCIRRSVMKSEERLTTKTRRQYTDEFKAEAVRLVRDPVQPVAQVARDLGIADHLLYRWQVKQRQAESQGHTRESLRTEQEELVRLRRENVTLKQERDFLRRAAAFFAKESR